MSLLQKASIITTPTAYAEDYLYSIKPAYALGSELVTNGTFATDSGWTKGSAWTISGGKAVYDDSAINSISQSLSFTSQKRYQIQFEVSDATGSGARFKFSNVADSVVYFDYAYYTNGLHTLFYKASANSSEINIKGHTSGSSFKLDNVSVKEVTDADFDFDRNSTGTRVNEDYLIEDVPYNLVSYSENFNTNWQKIGSPTIEDNNIIAPNGTLTGAKLTRGTNTTPLRGNNVTSLGQPFTFSIYAKKGNHNQINLDIGDELNATYTLTDDWKRFTVTSTPNTYTHIDITLPFSTSGDFIYIWGAQVVKGDQPKDYLKTTDRLDIPRIDYTNGEPSILLEKSRTNLVTYSNDFTNAAWDKDNSTITANSTTSPEGLVNASKLTEDTATSSHRVEETVTVSNGATVTCSVYAKKGERNFILLFESNSADGAYFNLDTGKFVRVDGTPVDYNIQDLKNGWYRCSIVVTVPSTSCRFQIYMTQTSNTSSYTGDGSSSMFIYGAQVEVGSYSTSLIHTSGSTVTRSSDVANNAGNSDLFNDSEGVLYAEIAALSNVASHRRITISDGTNNNRIVVGYNTTTNQIFYFVKVGGSTVASGNYTPINITEFKKIAIKYKVNDFAFYVDGIVRHTDSSGAVFSANTLNSLQFAQGSGDDLFFLGRAKMVAVFKEALTDLELEKLTGYNNHELYMNYYNRLSYLGLVEEYNVESDINNYIL